MKYLSATNRWSVGFGGPKVTECSFATPRMPRIRVITLESNSIENPVELKPRELLGHPNVKPRAISSQASSESTGRFNDQQRTV